MSLVSAIYAVAVFGAFLYARRRGIDGLLVATVFLIPWFGLMKDVGVTINADRLVAAVLVVALVFKHRVNALSKFTPFFVYGVGVTIAASVALPESTALYTASKGELRWLFQLPMWAIAIAPGAAVALSENPGIVRSCCRSFLASTTVLALLGLLQFGVFYATGVDLFPLGFLTGGETRSAAFQTGTDDFLGGHVFRACALGGEPKHLAYSAMLALTLLFLDRVTGHPLALRRRHSTLLLAIHVAALVATFSTQGYMLLVTNLALVLVGTAVYQGMTRGQARLIAVIVVAAVALFAIPGLTEVLWMRTVERLNTKSAEDWNEAVWFWFRETPSAWPLGVGFGNVHLHAAPYIPFEYLYYMKGNVFVAKAGFLRILTETGIVGLMLFVATLVRPLVVLAKRAKVRDPSALAIMLFTIAVVMNYFVTNDGPTYVFWAIGLAIAAAKAGAAEPSPSPREGSVNHAVATGIDHHA